MSIDFESAATGDTDNHMSLIKWCEQSQSKAIVGGTLLSQADGKTSTNAQSTTHEIQFEKIIKSDAKQLGRSITDSLISHMMRLNYPNITEDRYPAFQFDTSDIEDMTQFSESLGKLVSVGMKIPLSWAHEKLGIPEPADENEAILSAQQEQPFAVPNLAMNTFHPHLIGQLVAANSSQLPIEDQAMQLLLNEQTAKAQTTVQDWTQRLLKNIQAGQNEDDVLTLLQDIYPHDDEPALQEKLTRLIFACEVMGRLSIEGES